MKLARLMAYVSLAANIALAAELAALQRQLEGLAPKPEQFTVEGFAGAHVPQRGFVADDSNWQRAAAARQSGKSFGCDGKLFRNAKQFPRSVNVLLGLKGTAVRANNWEPIWKPLMWRYGIPKRCLNETRMSCELDNGSRIMFGGTANYEHIKNQLGKRLDNGIFIVDESQDQPDKVLNPLIDSILPPMCTPTTKIVLAGVIPEVPAGRFYREGKSKRWRPHNWGRFANVHTPEARAQFAQYLEDIGFTEAFAMFQACQTPEDREVFDKHVLERGLTGVWSIIARDWLGLEVFDPGAAAFRYVAARNGFPGLWVDGKRFVGIIPDHIRARFTSYSVGIDPGARDRAAIVVVAWGPGTGLWVVEEWVTDRNAGTVWSEIGTELGRIQKAYGPSWYYADFGGSTMSLDVFGRDHGVPLVMAAKKADRRFQVDRVNDSLMRAEAWIPEGSQLEGDLLKTKWDKDARERGEFEWSSANHPDVGDAFRYAAHAFYERPARDEAPEDKTPSVARRLKLLKNQEQEGYFAAKRRRLG